ncbi:parkin coregulated gene protein homolog [Centruroides vittatus]|uniref:parkin coregulated gene protein homolog n=1 Tax=Centruroides vittatus TaxID=120091 RepID=UPI00350FE279
MDNERMPAFHNIIGQPLKLNPDFSTRFKYDTWKISDSYFGGQSYPLPEYRPSFRERYEWGELPILILKDERMGCSIRWMTAVGNLDYDYFLPIFFDGLREECLPYSIAAYVALQEMLNEGGKKIVQALPFVIPSLSETLYGQNKETIGKALIALQHLYEKTGPALWPYYNKFIPILNHLKLQSEYKEIRIRPRQSTRSAFDCLVLETLALLKS